MLEKVLELIDAINEWAGRITKWFIVCLILVLFYEVALRYFFNSPTVWAYDISYMLGGGFFVLGMGVTLLHEKHVRVDVFSSKFSPRAKAIVDVILSILLFFPAFGLLLIKVVPYVLNSWATRERSLESFWRPPIYPFKTFLLIGIVLLLLQGIAVFIRNIKIIKGKEGS